MGKGEGAGGRVKMPALLPVFLNCLHLLFLNEGIQMILEMRVNVRECFRADADAFCLFAGVDLGGSL